MQKRHGIMKSCIFGKNKKYVGNMLNLLKNARKRTVRHTKEEKNGCENFLTYSREKVCK